MKSWFEIKARAVLGPDPNDDKEVTMLDRIVRWVEEGIEYKADPKHRRIILEYFGLNSKTKPMFMNGDKEDKVEEWEEEYLGKSEAKEFGGLAARLNFMSLDCPNLQ
eukprot:12328876-Karenia_brevis.AAC.1